MQAYLLIHIVFGFRRPLDRNGSRTSQCKANSRDFWTRWLAGGESICSTNIGKTPAIMLEVRMAYTATRIDDQVVVKGYTLNQ
ncbi:MAG: hypothetical protein ACRD5B_05160 [Nitrososphaeraceae archaeon]